MRKLCLLIIMLIMPLIVLGKEYIIDEVGVKITFDDDFYVFTRDNYKNNEILNELGIPEEYMENFFTMNKAYVDVVPKDFSYDMVVNIVMENLEMTNLSNYPDNMINETSKSILKTIPDAVYSIYNNGKYKFMRISFFDTTTSYNIYRYYTVFGNKGISFHIQKKGVITENDKKVLDDAVKTIEFDTINQNTRESSEIQKEIDNYEKKSFNWERVIIGTIVGAVVGGLTSVVLKLKNKKSNESTGV